MTSWTAGFIAGAVTGGTLGAFAMAVLVASKVEPAGIADGRHLADGGLLSRHPTGAWVCERCGQHFERREA